MPDKPSYRVIDLPPPKLTKSKMQRDLKEIKGFTPNQWKARKIRLKLHNRAKRRNRK